MQKIKKGDWYILLPEQQIKQAQKDLPTHRDWKKIIATTDKELEIIHRQLYPNGDYTGVANLIPLPQIPESFIEYFVSEYNQGREITSVLVEYEEYCEHGTFPVLYNKPKQVIERGAGGHICSGTNRLKINSDCTINIKPIRDSWTREEILNDIELAMIEGLDLGQYRDKWIKQITTNEERSFNK